MTQQAKKANYLRFKDNYLTASRKEKGRIIDLVSETNSEHRKQVIRNLSRLTKPQKPKKLPEKRGRKTIYQSEEIRIFFSLTYGRKPNISVAGDSKLPLKSGCPII